MKSIIAARAAERESSKKQYCWNFVYKRLVLLEPCLHSYPRWLVGWRSGLVRCSDTLNTRFGGASTVYHFACVVGRNVIRVYREASGIYATAERDISYSRVLQFAQVRYP